MRLSLPDRFAAYYMPHGGDSTTFRPEYLPTDPSNLQGRATQLSTSNALAANAEGRFERRVTHSGRMAYNEDLRYGMVLVRKRDEKCFFVLSVRDANTETPNGNPAHLQVDLSEMDPKPDFG